VGRWRTRYSADAGQTVHPDFKASLAGPLRFSLYNLAVDFVASSRPPPPRGLTVIGIFLFFRAVMALIAGTRTRIWVAPSGAY